MSPVSSPEPVDKEEGVRDAVKEALDQALAPIRSMQREIDARLGRLELSIRELELSDHARAASFTAPAAAPAAAPPLPPARAHQPTLPMGVGPAGAPPHQAPIAPVAALAPAVAPAPAPTPVASPIAASPPPAPPAPVQVDRSVGPFHSIPPTRPVLPLPGSDDPFDASMLPDELNGGRRKKMMAVVALVVAVLGVGGLVALAIASQAVHGL
jgi:hypothetical protein